MRTKKIYLGVIAMTYDQLKSLFPIDQHVRNFGQLAKVVDYRNYGENHFSLVLSDFNGERWIADPNLCTHVKTAKAFMYKDGLISF